MYFSHLFAEQQKPFSFLLFEYTHSCLHVNILKVPKMNPYEEGTQVNSAYDEFSFLIFTQELVVILDLDTMEGGGDMSLLIFSCIAKELYCW